MPAGRFASGFSWAFEPMSFESWRRASCFVLVSSLVLGLTACDETGSDRILTVDATGSLVGIVFLDRNGSGALDPTDGPLPGVALRVVAQGAREPVARVVSTAAGTMSVDGLPVGDYNLVLESPTVPDSVRLIRISANPAASDTTKAHITAGDTTAVAVILGYPTETVAAAKALPSGRRVFVEGVTLNAWATFGDSTLHVADTTGVIRVTRVTAVAVSSGQRVRILGTTDVRAGQRTLTDAVAFPLGSGQAPAPIPISTGVAATADNGRLDAALVRVTQTTILGAETNTVGDVALTVTDGSGLLQVLLDRDTGISPVPYIPGAMLAATGLLVRNEARAGEWQLKPRSVADLSVTFASATVAQARQLQQGRIVSIEGVALNAWAAFADSSVHVADSTGVIRTIRVQPANLFVGDRVRMLGVVVFRDGQPMLTNVTPTVLGPGVAPLAERVDAGSAADAEGGRLDAALVRVTGAVIGDTATTAGDFPLLVDDGSGPLEVLLDRDVGFQLRPYEPGAVLDVTGLLVPEPGGRAWRLKPRQQSDIVVTGSTISTIAQARTAPVGTLVSVPATALNEWAAFGDSTVHLSDATGTIRAVRVRPDNIVRGSRVRMLGTIALVDGQPTISNVITAVLGPGPLPTPQTVTAAMAAQADGGRLDGALVSVATVSVTDTASVGGDVRLTVTGSGPGGGTLEVLLDRDAGFTPGVIAPGWVLNVTGVLVPGSSPNVWRLKPRPALSPQTADVVIVSRPATSPLRSSARRSR
jgi:hypothetical protein